MAILREQWVPERACATERYQGPDRYAIGIGKADARLNPTSAAGASHAKA